MTSITRICKDCKIEKPLDKKHFQNVSNKNSKNECYRKYCNPCKVARSRNYMKVYHKKHYIPKRRTNKKIKLNITDALLPL